MTRLNAQAPEVPMLVCPGCGARNEPTARACDWCARPFVAGHHQIQAPWLAPLAIGAIAIIAVGTIILALVGTRSSADRGEPPLQAIEPTLIEPSSPTEQLATATLAPPESPGSEEFVRIANTGGSGAFIRREPQASAQGLFAHRDGTVLRIVGPDTAVASRVWRQVEDRQGNRGWTPREFLAPSEVGF